MGKKNMKQAEKKKLFLCERTFFFPFVNWVKKLLGEK